VKQVCQVWGCEHPSISFHISFDLDQDLAAGLSQAGDASSTEDALILVNWKNSQKKSKKRFVLILIR
jgi:hypothetical protein